ncbi:L,D-transpeptidase family protein [Acidisoma cellulosilyticum]|nr:L,D-transpeptidase family protein [Acidisoma cellulosilyticum]
MTADGFLTLGSDRYPACFGRAGITREKEEGDFATPVGLLPLRRVLYRADRLAAPRTVLPLEPLGPRDGWCDDPKDPAYNRMVRLPYAGRHEALWRDDAVYDLIGVLGWNDSPVASGRGSAIFLHVTTPDRAPTAGCIALSLDHLREVLAKGLTGIEVYGA